MYSIMKPANLQNIVIKNFRQVTDWLYRGGQPDIEDLGKLATSGFRSIICLRWNVEAVKKRT